MDMTDSANGFTTPIDRLPSELIAHIFIYLVIDKALPIPCIKQAPLLLLRVCRRWTDIAMHTGRLWASINLSFKRPFEADVESVALQKWLSRAGSCAMDFHFDAVDCFQQSTTRYDRSSLREIASTPGIVTHTILPHINRSRSLNIRIRRPFVQEIIQMFALGMPHLQELSLELMAFNQTLDAPPPILDLTKCPKLTTLTLRKSFDLQLGSNNGQTTFQHLTNLALTADMDKAWQILVNAPLVQACAVTFIFPVTAPSNFSPSSHPINLPMLQELKVSTSSRVEPHMFFDGLYVPALRTLMIDFGFVREEMVRWPHLNDMLERSRPPLESLHIWSLPCNGDELLHTLRLIPSLRFLSILHIGLENSLWMALTDYPPEHPATELDKINAIRKCSTVLLRNLESLRVQYCGTLSIDYIRDIVITRFQARNAKPLRSLHLAACGFTKEDLLESAEFGRCIDDGLQVNVALDW